MNHADSLQTISVSLGDPSIFNRKPSISRLIDFNHNSLPLAKNTEISIVLLFDVISPPPP